MRRSVLVFLIAPMLSIQSCATSITSGDTVPDASNGLIAYTLRDRAGKLQIFTAHVDRSNKRQLTLEGDNGRPDWSPGGTKIAFMAQRDQMFFVAVMDKDGANQTMLAEGEAPDWSPDGRQIAFSRGGQIWVMSPDGSNLTQITNSPPAKAAPS